MKKVASGQPLRIPASTFNSMIDAANDYKSRLLNRQSEVIAQPAKNGIVTVRNLSGFDCDRFSVLAIDTVSITPTENLQEFASRFTLDVVTPESQNEGRFVVLQEPVLDGGMGKAMIAGVTPVLLFGDSALGAKSAGIEPGQITLISNSSGAQILWEEDTAGEALHLALVRFPVAGNIIQQFAVRSVQDDYLICQAWDGGFLSGIDVQVAKPFLLKNSFFDGQTVDGVSYTYLDVNTREATDGTTTETQLVTPSYFLDATIYAVKDVIGGVDLNGSGIEWLDLNVDGRAWAKQ